MNFRDIVMGEPVFCCEVIEGFTVVADSATAPCREPYISAAILYDILHVVNEKAIFFGCIGFRVFTIIVDDPARCCQPEHPLLRREGGL